MTGLVIAWRHTGGTGWEAYVAMKHGDAAAIVTWEPAAALRPVTDDRQQPLTPSRRT